ncbi:hypothetical protein MN608_08489 [Microdochium nivale]|nr:hypothetical protein MN608_08489 [Microdochium nivale]
MNNFLPRTASHLTPSKQNPRPSTVLEQPTLPDNSHVIDISLPATTQRPKFHMLVGSCENTSTYGLASDSTSLMLWLAAARPDDRVLGARTEVAILLLDQEAGPAGVRLVQGPQDAAAPAAAA